MYQLWSEDEGLDGEREEDDPRQEVYGLIYPHTLVQYPGPGL